MRTKRITSALRSRRALRVRRFAFIVLVLTVLSMLFTTVALAQAPNTMPGDILDAYRGARAPAIAVFNRYAMRLFRALALVEMAWVGVLLVLERSDFQGFTAGLLRKLLVLFAFFWLLQNGVDFSDRIMSSLTTIGAETAGIPPGGGLAPGNVFYRGVQIAVNMATSSAITGFLLNPALTAVVIISSLLVFLSFCVVTVHLIMAQVESYIVVSAGLIFLGFGGNTITRPYVERYFALSVAVGVKLMILYVVVGIGNVLSANWAAQAATLSTSLFPYQLCLDMLGGSIIFAVVAWGVPKFAASLLSGSPSFSGGDIIGMGMNVVSGGLMVAGGAALAARGAAMVVGGGAARLAAASSVSGAGAGVLAERVAALPGERLARNLLVAVVAGILGLVRVRDEMERPIRRGNRVRRVRLDQTVRMAQPVVRGATAVEGTGRLRSPRAVLKDRRPEHQMQLRRVGQAVA